MAIRDQVHFLRSKLAQAEAILEDLEKEVEVLEGPAPYGLLPPSYDRETGHFYTGPLKARIMWVLLRFPEGVHAKTIADILQAKPSSVRSLLDPLEKAKHVRKLRPSVFVGTRLGFDDWKIPLDPERKETAPGNERFTERHLPQPLPAAAGERIDASIDRAFRQLVREDRKSFSLDDGPAGPANGTNGTNGSR